MTPVRSVGRGYHGTTFYIYFTQRFLADGMDRSTRNYLCYAWISLGECAADWMVGLG
jgi:beta-xylosidase